jgi:hypothetical protein
MPIPETLRIAHFSHHHDVRVLAEEGAHDAREAHLIGDLDLRDVVLKLVFDRVLDRHDVALRAVQLVDGCVERGRFAGAGRARDDDHAVRRLNRLQPVLHDIRGHSELGDVDADAGRVEKPHNDLLTVKGGKNGDAGAEFARHVLHVDAAVLRLTPLVDVHAGGQLDSGEDGRSVLGVKAAELVHDAVNAETMRV